MSAVKLEFEFYDGSTLVVREVDPDEAWHTLLAYEHQAGEIVSAWRDDEPWVGVCTDMREGTP